MNSKDLKIRVSEQDKLYLQARADAERLKLSAYVRNQLLRNVNTK